MMEFVFLLFLAFIVGLALASCPEPRNYRTPRIDLTPPKPLEADEACKRANDIMALPRIAVSDEALERLWSDARFLGRGQIHPAVVALLPDTFMGIMKGEAIFYDRERTTQT